MTGSGRSKRRTEVMAMAINKVIVIGNLGANPVVRALPNSGQNVANFSLATTERFTDRSGTKQQRTEWHRVVHSDACGYVPTVLEQRPSGLHRGTADDPPVRGEGRERDALLDRDRSAAN